MQSRGAPIRTGTHADHGQGVRKEREDLGDTVAMVEGQRAPCIGAGEGQAACSAARAHKGKAGCSFGHERMVNHEPNSKPNQK